MISFANLYGIYYNCIMKKVRELQKHLKRGRVYRRADIAKWSSAIDRHLAEFVSKGILQKLSPGIYYYPKQSPFGPVPPDETLLIKSFLKDDDFLLTSPNTYNTLGVGTTQLYNKTIVYNHKRHGEVMLGGKNFFFHTKPKFPRKLTAEFLLVDLVNNIDDLAEDHEQILRNVKLKALAMDCRLLKRNVKFYGSARARKTFREILEKPIN